MKKILFTGAHHNSALALLDWIKSNSKDEIEFIWIGKKFAPSSDSVLTPEYTEVSGRNVKFFNISAGKLYRFRDPRFFLIFLKNLLLIPQGFKQAYDILKVEKPDLIVSFGGYIAVPVVIMGYLLKIKSVSHEQTLSIGLANQIIYLFAKKIYTAWPVNLYPNNYQEKMSFVGLPLKSIFINQIRTGEKLSFSNEKPVIYVTGGKNGSHTINQAVLNALSQICQNFNVIWACGGVKGAYDFDRINDEIKKYNLDSQIMLKAYFEETEIGKVFNTASVVVSRSGAHTVYELIYCQKPCILIPIPWASNNEQLKNAQVVKNAGIGEIIQEGELSGAYLAEKLLYVYSNINNYKNSSMQVSENSSAEMGHEILQIL